MEVPIVDRSPIDMLLSGDYGGREPRPPRRYKIRSDPAILPLGYWPTRSQEHRTFDQRKEVRVKVAAPSYKERLPYFLPGFIKWPLESAISQFLGETQQRPLHMRIEVSLPHLLIFDMNKILCTMDCALFLLDAALLFLYRSELNLQYLLVGMMSGFLYGIFLRTRQERVFEWSSYGIMFCFAFLMTFGGIVSAPELYDLSHLPGLSHLLDNWYRFPIQCALSTAVCLVPFFYDRHAFRIRDDFILLSLLLLTLVYSSNLFLPLGAWLGRFVKMAPAPQTPLQPATATQASVLRNGPPGMPVSSQQPTTGLMPPTQTPAPPVRRMKQPEQDPDDFLYPRRWQPPITSPYEGYGAGGASGTGFTPVSDAGYGSNASSSYYRGGGSLGGPSGLLTDGRRSSLPNRGMGGYGAGGYGAGNGYSSNTPTRGSYMSSIDDDEPPPLSSPGPVGPGLVSRRRSQPSRYSSGGDPYDRASPAKRW